MEYRHIPVLVKEVLAGLNLRPAGIYLDATTGEGGHSEKILEKISPLGKVIGIDCDADALKVAGNRLKKYREQCRLIKGNFRDLRVILEREGIKEVEGILFDLGVSSFQLADARRGFSFKSSGPLDMRMDTTQNLQAADLVNNLQAKKLAKIISQYGEERWSQRIAARIVQQRPILTTSQLITVIKSAIPLRYRHGRLHLATRTFQALRIAVNEELENLRIGLLAAIDFLKPSGRIVVIAYHSLEDRIVKRTFRGDARVKIITRKPLYPTEEEVLANPCSRSAKLRVGEKI